MRVRLLNRLIHLGVAAALAVTAAPLVRAWMPNSETAAPTGGAADVVPGAIVVDARDTLTAADLAGLNARYGLNLRYNSVNSREEQLLIADVPADQVQGVLEGLRKEPLVEVAEPMFRVRMPETEFRNTRADPLRADESSLVTGTPTSKSGVKKWQPNDPRYAEQWNFRLIGSEEAWDRVRDKGAGRGIVVAVIDTGVAAEEDSRCYHARDFKGTRFVRGFDFVNDDDHPNDDHGHGTHVAGTIAETTDNGEGVAGLAFDATIMPLKVLDSWGGGTSADIADAIRFAADNGANVINMSLGGPFPDRVMQLACQYAAKKGVVIVCAAGNSSGGPVGYPAAFSECIAVSSVGPTGDIAPYSSIGKQVAIAGPGGDKSRGEGFGVLQNTVMYESGERQDDYFSFQGTSMASPHVAAVAALAMARGVKDRDQVRALLQRAATPKKPQTKYGAGILNAAKSVELADNAVRDSWVKLVFTLIAAATGLGVGAVRSQARGLLAFPSLTFGLVVGLAGPDLATMWAGQSSPFTLVFHSALIPLYLLWEADSKAVYRFVGAMAAGAALHLGYDAFTGAVGFGGAGVVPAHGVPWLWTNCLVGLGAAVAAYRRSVLAK